MREYCLELSFHGFS
jgi:hypothetical protein